MSFIRALFKLENLLNWLLALVPVVLWMRPPHFLHGVLQPHGDDLHVFICACVGIIPLAGLMGHATEGLSARAGPGVGGLLNASFGNAAELIIGFAALRAGKIDIVQASITGSIIGNLLFVLGLAAFCGGLKREKQTFNQTAAGVATSALFLGVVGLLVPTLVAPALARKAAAGGPSLDSQLQLISEWIAPILLLIYVAKLLFSLKTHHHLYNEEADAEAEDEHHWSLGLSMGVLGGATAVTAVVAEILVGAVEHAAGRLGLNDVFVGVVIVAVVGNAAEHSTAVIVAIKGKMNLAITVAVESSLQIALFVAPVLVFLGLLYPGLPHPMTLHFSDVEVYAVAIAVAAVGLISLDGETNWFEGLQLVAVYGVLGIAFYFAG